MTQQRGMAWTAALDAAETDVESAEQLIDALRRGDDVPLDLPGAGWAVPVLPASMPTELVERARLLLERQDQVSEHLEAAMVHARVQLRGLGKLDRAEPPPIFVDTAV